MVASCFIRRAVKPLRFAGPKHASIRNFSFTFNGAKTLDEIIHKDLLQDKTGAEVADVWYSYHESKDNVLGLVLDGKEGEVVLPRAAKCPFFIQPVFRDDGFFMLISQFLAPSHFLLGYLEDYKMDPNAATPLLTFSVFNDYADKDSKDISLVRCDILNKGIQDDEVRKVVQSVVDNYRKNDDFVAVQTFNERPDDFDADDYISRMNFRWKQDPPTVST